MAVKQDQNSGNMVLFGKKTAKGRRPKIEDRTEARHLTTGAGMPLTVAMVADGIGGNEYGELAAELTVKTTFAELETAMVDDPAQLPELLAQALTRANDVVYKAAREDRAKRNMGTTATIAAIHHDRLYIANVGDSRTYLLRDGHATQLTRDHIWALAMTQQGRLTAEEAAEHPKAGELVRSIGYDPEVNVDLGLYLNGYGVNNLASEEAARGEQGLQLRANDRLVLCSDGLIKDRHNGAGHYVEDEEMVQLVTRHAPDKAARVLVDRAISRDADDNVSAVVLEMPGSKRAFYIPRSLIGVIAAILIVAVFAAFFLFSGGNDEPVIATGTPLASTTRAAQMTDDQSADSSAPAASEETFAIRVQQGAAGARWRSGDLSGPVQNGDTLQVPGNGSLQISSADSLLILSFSEEASLIIRPGTELEIKANGSSPQIILQQGHVILAASGQVKSVANPYGAVGSSENGIFAISYSQEPFSFTVSCLLEACQINGDMSGTIDLGEGQASTVGGSGEPGPPEPVSYEEFSALNDTFTRLSLSALPTATATPAITSTPTPILTPTVTNTAIFIPTETPVPPSPTPEPTDPPPTPISQDHGGGDDGGNNGETDGGNDGGDDGGDDGEGNGDPSEREIRNP